LKMYVPAGNPGPGGKNADISKWAEAFQWRSRLEKTWKLNWNIYFEGHNSVPWHTWWCGRPIYTKRELWSHDVTQHN
jgi:hypothetical protein